MADISIAYDRQFTDADLSAIVARATATINVMQQLGATYQSLPGYEMAGYQTESDSLEGEVTAVQGLADQIRAKLIAIDREGRAAEGEERRHAGRAPGSVEEQGRGRLALADYRSAAVGRRQYPHAPTAESVARLAE